MSAEQYLKRVKGKSGFVFNPSSVYLDEATPRDWQFRIAVFPSQENLQKAATALAPILCDENLDFKCLVLNEDGKQHIEDVSWDGSLRGNNSDRDQRGKEICIYMRFNEATQTYEKNPEEWKALMMKCWKALLDANVDIGYITPPVGDKEVDTDFDLISPFSYTSFKPYTGRHGILHQTHYNPNGFTDPLADVKITQQDLQKYEITVAHVNEMQKKRIVYQQQHLDSARKNIIADLTAVKEDSKNGKTITDYLAEFNQLTDNKDIVGLKAVLQGKAAKELLESIEKNCPLQSNSGMDKQQAVADLIGYCELSTGDRFNKEEFIKFRQSLDEYIITNTKQDINEIIQDFQENTKLKEFLDEQEISLVKLQSMIQTRPQAMQSIYRRLVHIQNESDSLATEQKRSLVETVKKISKIDKPEAVHQAFNKLQGSRLYTSEQLKQAQQQVYEKLYADQEKWRWIKTGIAAVGLATVLLAPIAIGAIAYLWTINKKNAPWQQMDFKEGEYEAISDVRKGIMDKAGNNPEANKSLFNSTGELAKVKITDGGITKMLMTKEQAERIRAVKEHVKTNKENANIDKPIGNQADRNKAVKKSLTASKERSKAAIQKLDAESATPTDQLTSKSR